MTRDEVVVAILVRRLPRRHRLAQRARVRLRVRRAAQLAAFRRKLRRLLGRQGLHDQEREAIVLAAKEAVTNALESCPAAARRVKVTVSHIGGSVYVEVLDAGRGLKRDCANLITLAEATDERGRGLYLMRELMEGLEILPQRRGTLVRMVKKLEAEEDCDLEVLASRRPDAAGPKLV
jgi:anti-sigma regulatory factor (Ser/Thr protein kinase)